MTLRGDRVCPLSYHHCPNSLAASDDDLQAETVFVVGGIYGNVEALRFVEERANKETARIIFNGDFNFFNSSSRNDWMEVNQRVRQHYSISGNVEVEVVDALSDGSCGCAYPSYVATPFVERSNAIVSRLRNVARCAEAAGDDGISKWLRSLPRFMTCRIGRSRVGVLHGDPKALAGWAFSAEAMEPCDAALRAQLGCTSDDTLTAEAQVLDWLTAADVDAFACTHTCLPFAQRFGNFGSSGDDRGGVSDGGNEVGIYNLRRNGNGGVVVNNGAAGMPNFRSTTYGVMTRLSSRREVPADSLYGATTESGLRVDAVPVRYDHAAWLRKFTTAWPERSPAYLSYFDRIAHGPHFTLAQAARRGFTLLR